MMMDAQHAIAHHSFQPTTCMSNSLCLHEILKFGICCYGEIDIAAKRKTSKQKTILNERQFAISDFDKLPSLICNAKVSFSIATHSIKNNQSLSQERGCSSCYAMTQSAPSLNPPSQRTTFAQDTFVWTAPALMRFAQRIGHKGDGVPSLACDLLWTLHHSLQSLFNFHSSSQPCPSASWISSFAKLSGTFSPWLGTFEAHHMATRQTHSANQCCHSTSAATTVWTHLLVKVLT